MDEKRTPGPWHIMERGDTFVIIGHPTWPCSMNGREGEWEVAALDDLVGEHPGEVRANAAFIVKAANAYAELVGALVIARGILIDNGYVAAGSHGIGDTEINTIDAILAKVGAP